MLRHNFRRSGSSSCVFGRRWLTLACVLLLLFGCARAPQTAQEAVGENSLAAIRDSLADRYHGVIVWLGPNRTDTVRVAFEPEWRRTPVGSDTVWAFAGAELEGEDGATAYGRIEGDTLVWGIAEMVGDVGVGARFAGAVMADGRVRGCGAVRTSAIGPAGRQAPRAAFVLAPGSAPVPGPDQAPVRECEAGGMGTG